MARWGLRSHQYASRHVSTVLHLSAGSMQTEAFRPIALWLNGD